jgi:hypothetical protein
MYSFCDGIYKVLWRCNTCIEQTAMKLPIQRLLVSEFYLHPQEICFGYFANYCSDFKSLFGSLFSSNKVEMRFIEKSGKQDTIS